MIRRPLRSTLLPYTTLFRSRMVPTPWLRVMTPLLVALVRLTNKVSSGSTMVSPLIVTAIVFEASPAAELQLPVAARESDPAVALPSAVGWPHRAGAAAGTAA